MLHRHRGEGRAQLGQQGVASGPVVGKNANLDEPVRRQRRVELATQRRRCTLGADADDRVEVMRLGALLLALRRREEEGGHAPIIVRGEGRARMATRGKGKKLNKAWLHDHLNDPYVKLAQREGYRARAAYKLKEIDEQLQLLRPGQLVVDLGATPGAWSQYVRRKFGRGATSDTGLPGPMHGTIIALDVLELEPVDGVDFIRGDLREAEVLEALESRVGDRQVDVVLSDMAPNLSGIAASDAARMAELVELALDFARAHLTPGGALVCKVFHGSGYSQLVELFKSEFRSVKAMKPKASRAKSAETFLVGIGLKARPSGADIQT